MHSYTGRMINDYRRALGQILAEKRKAAGLNKQQLSLMVGVNRLSIRLIERGEANPTVDMLLKLTRGLGVSLADIMVETERRLAGSEAERSQCPAPFQAHDRSSNVLYFLTKL